MTPEQGESDRPTLAATQSAAPLLPSGGALELRRLREAIETSMFDRAPEVIRIGRFTILDRVGAGGMGVVYAAYDPTLDRKVAVKVLRHEDAGGERSRLIDEARALARLSHPCIVAVHEVGEQDGQIFLAMEFVEGTSLEHWIRRDEGVRPWREVLEVFGKAGRGLAAAHDAGLVHRDFKPHNVMLSTSGAVKVLDFGLARAMPDGANSESVSDTGPHRAQSGSSTVTGALAGTPAYMSPEQLASQRATARSDQFSFCVALFEALHGHRPFPGRRIEEIAISVLEGRQLKPENASSIPGFVRAVVARGLSTDPAQRFGSMHALLDALDRGPRTRRFKVGGAVALATTLTAGAATWSVATSDADRCADADAAMDDVWGESARQRVRSQLQSSKSPRAAATWSRAAPLLDGYAQAWRHAASEGCRAHAERRLQDSVFERRSACLRTRRASFRTLTELLDEGDATVLDRTAALAAALPSLDSCKDEADDAVAFALPQDPIAAADVIGQRNALAHARMLEEAGRYDSAAAVVQRVQTAANELAFAPLIAEAAVVAGSVAMYRDAPSVADEALGNALEFAIAADHDAAALEATAKRAFVRAELQRNDAAAVDDARHASGLARRPAEHDPRLQWLVHNNLGVVAERRGDLEAAIEHHGLALEITRSRGELAGWDELATLTNLAYATLGNDDPQGALVLATEAVTLAEVVLGPDHPQLPMPLHALAEIQQALGADADAEATLRRSLALQASGEDGASPGAIVDLAALATILGRRGDRAGALELAERALDGANASLGPEHPITADVLATRDALNEHPTAG